MLSAGLKFFTDTPFTVIGLLLFVFSFGLVVLQIYLPKNSKSFYQKIAEMPLKPEEKV